MVGVCRTNTLSLQNNKQDDMDGLMRIDTVQQYNDYFGVETYNPLVAW